MGPHPEATCPPPPSLLPPPPLLGLQASPRFIFLAAFSKVKIHLQGIVGTWGQEDLHQRAGRKHCLSQLLGCETDKGWLPWWWEAEPHRWTDPACPGHLKAGCPRTTPPLSLPPPSSPPLLSPRRALCPPSIPSPATHQGRHSLPAQGPQAALLPAPKPPVRWGPDFTPLFPPSPQWGAFQFPRNALVLPTGKSIETESKISSCHGLGRENGGGGECATWRIL